MDRDAEQPRHRLEEAEGKRPRGIVTNGRRHVRVEGLERLLGIETEIERGIETGTKRSRGIEAEMHRGLGTYRQRPRGIRLRDRSRG